MYGMMQVKEAKMATIWFLYVLVLSSELAHNITYSLVDYSNNPCPPLVAKS